MKRALIRLGQRKLNGFLFDVSPDCIMKQHKVYLSNVCKFKLEHHIIVRDAYSVHMILFIFVTRITIEFLTFYIFST